ncbi:MAG: FkbM family methyltransferase [Sandaracinus sp.]
MHRVLAELFSDTVAPVPLPPPPTEVRRIFGGALAAEVEEYFEHGAHVAPGDVVLDVGANIGAFAGAVATRTQGDVTLHCFEPAAPLFDTLRSNFRRHPLLARTRHALHPVALSTREDDGRERAFYYFRHLPTDSTYDLERKLDAFRDTVRRAARALEGSERDGWLRQRGGRSLARVLDWLCRDESRLGPWMAERVAGLETLRCRLASLERFAAQHELPRIDLLKIDVEGAELDVLRGVGDAWPRVRRVVVETDRREGRERAVIELLTAHGLRVTSCRPPRVAADGDRSLLVICASRG